MKILTVYILSATLIANIFSCSKTNSPTSNDTEKVQSAVDSVRNALSQALGIDYPSLNVLIQTPTQKIFVSSVPSGNTPLTADTYFRFASNTKNFTSASILNMNEDGWLDYKAKITDNIPGTDSPYVPATADWGFPYKADITIEELLQHSAGVFDVDNNPVPGYNGQTYTEYMLALDSNHQFTTDEMVKVLTDKGLYFFTPGSGYHYSNTGFSILGKIISRVYSIKANANKTYADYLNDYVIGGSSPVPIEAIHFPILATDKALPDPFVSSTVLNPTGTEHYSAFNMSAQVGEGNGYGTMNALNTYVRSMMKGQNALQPASVQLMQTDKTSYDTSYGLGCDYRPNLGYGHNGARIGYLSFMAYDPDTDVSVVSMINLWDLRKGDTSFAKCILSMYDGAYAARSTLGYPGKP